MSISHITDGASTASREPPALRARSARARRERILFARHKAGDRRAREELIERFLPLARSVARRYEHPAEPLDDLVQIASVALVKAVDGFDVDRGHAFTSYAVPTIKGELKRHFRDRSWTVRPPRALQERVMRLDDLTPRVSHEVGRAQTVSELAAASGVSHEHIREALHARGARNALSLQATVGAETDRRELQDTLAAREDGFADIEARAVFDGLLNHLPPRSATVLRLRFELDLTQTEIGDLLGLSQMQISRILHASIARLRGITEHHERMFERRLAHGAQPARSGGRR